MSSTRFAPSVSCLAVDEVGRCKFVRACTDLFFDVVDRRHEKEGPNTMIPASNVAPSGWDEFFTGDETLLCALDRLFDKASVFKMRGPSYRGRELDTYSVEAAPQAIKVRGIQPKRAWQRCRPGNRLPAHWPKSADWDWRLSTGWNVVKIA